MCTQNKSTFLQKNEEDLKLCKKLTHKLGANFSIGFRFLPKEKKGAIYASYACCRIIDDLVDEGEKPSLDLLKEWEEKINKAYEGNPDHYATRALNFYLSKFPIPKKAFLDLIEGCKMDLTKNRYKNFKELLDYSEKVASSISEISLAIFGKKDEIANTYGKNLATAFQLTNIIRDIREDLDKGRIYIPLDEIEKAGLDERDFINLNFSEKMKNFLEKQCERVIFYFNSSKPLTKFVEKDSILCINLMRDVYYRIIKKILKNPLIVFKEKVSLSSIEKLLIIFKNLLKFSKSFVF